MTHKENKVSWSGLRALGTHLGIMGHLLSSLMQPEPEDIQQCPLFLKLHTSKDLTAHMSEQIPQILRTVLKNKMHIKHLDYFKFFKKFYPQIRIRLLNVYLGLDL